MFMGGYHFNLIVDVVDELLTKIILSMHFHEMNEKWWDLPLPSIYYKRGYKSVALSSVIVALSNVIVALLKKF